MVHVVVEAGLGGLLAAARRDRVVVVVVVGVTTATTLDLVEGTPPTEGSPPRTPLFLVIAASTAPIHSCFSFQVSVTKTARLVPPAECCSTANRYWFREGDM